MFFSCLHDKEEELDRPVFLSVIFSSLSVTWDLMRNTESQSHPRSATSETVGEGPAICVLTSLPGEISVAKV